MGALTSRQHAGVEEVDIPSNSVYRYPPKSGSYFASHFIMGGEKFDSTHPEGYLFGENSDLNFLGNRPVAFPYAAPPPQEPVKTLRSLINIRKDTLRLVKCAEEVKTLGEEAGRAKVHYNVEFTFDTDARVAITIYYQATEEFQNGIASYIPKDNSLQSETVHYKRGVGQQFCLPSHTVDPSEWAEEELGFDLDREVYPLVVHAVVDEGDEYFGHCHVLLGTFEKHTDGSFCVKPLKQKQVVDGVSYLLQEIYGIENKYNTQDSKVAEDEVSDNSAECVVCLSDVRDTLILPCRHLCLCNTCADTLRYQANNCPICRLPFRALLQIRAMRKKLGPLSPTGFNPIISSQTSDSEEHSSSENIPPGYEVVSLLEALNGPLTPSPAAPALHVLGDGHLSGMLPSYGSDGHLPPVRTLSPLDRLSDCSSQGIELKKSLSKSVSQNSSVLREEEDERSCSESETPLSQRPSAQHLEEECGITPESENLTMSSSGAIDQSSCTGTPLSSTISSPEDPASSSLAQSVMSMVSSQSRHSQISTDTVSSMSGSYIAPGTEEEGEALPSPRAASRAPSEEGEVMPAASPDSNFVGLAAEEQDAEGNDVMEEEDGPPPQEDGKRPGLSLPLIRFPLLGFFKGYRKGHRDGSVAPGRLVGKGGLLDGVSRQAGSLRAAAIFLAFWRPQGRGHQDGAASQSARGALNSRGLSSEASWATLITFLPSRFRLAAEPSPRPPRAAPAAPMIRNSSRTVSSTWEKGPSGNWSGFALVKKVADVSLVEGPSEPVGAEQG